MKKIVLLLTLIATTTFAMAQMDDQPKDTTWKKVYRATSTKINDLVHTKLECKFDYSKSWMYGKVWITLQPHFYATDSLTLDAKGMQLNEVALVNGTSKKKLEYDYNAQQIKIKLDKTYKGAEKYTIYIDYISKPDELETVGSAAITDTKGLYFINPRGEVADKPIQIWTQGETESTSAWCPTIESGSQKTTNEIYMTVPAKYVTLSNGLKISEKKNSDGTRTDYWKMDLPHAPYLFFMGVGDFAIIKDAPYKGKEVSYYVEKSQAPYAKAVFGNTPEMIKFFSEKLGVDYPWQKYSQIVGRDYVSGAMENTTATLHQESAYQNTRELADGNSWEETIAHELFHQWFGDLVTAESWSNITVNESFANYSEYLWNEYKYGKDAADEHNLEDMQGYVMSGSENKHLVRFNYATEMDVFDAVSYNKGGRILHMLRKYVGDEAFFKSLQNYLTTNKFKSGEAAQLRLAFEEVTGRDLNWFWNQWYYGAGHPKFEIASSYDGPTEKLMVVVKQTQKGDKVFKMPVDIDVYIGKDKARNTVWLQNRVDTFYFNYGSKPSLVDFDGDRTLLCEKKETKTQEEYIVQYEKNNNYLARREAIDYFAKNKLPELALGIRDKFAGLRTYTLNKIAALADKTPFLQDVEDKFVTEKDNKVKAAALKIFAKVKDAKYENYFTQNVAAESYSVAGAALEGLAALKPDAAYAMAKKYTNDAKGPLATILNKLIIDKGSENDFDYLTNQVKNAGLTMQAFNTLQSYTGYLAKLKNVSLVKKGIDAIKAFRAKVPAAFLDQVDPSLKGMLTPVGKAHGTEIVTYIENIFK
jgi:aminopeptidase N